MLALKPGRTVAADHLAEGLWGDESPPSGAKMVQLYVSHLRRLLGDNGVRIVTHGRGYELQMTDGEVDVLLAERLLDEHRPARRAGAVARPAAGGPGRGAVRGRRDPPPRRAAPARHRDGGRRRPRGRSPRRGDRRAGRAGRRAPAARARPRPADARALPLRPAVGGARGLPRRARLARRGDRRRAGRRASGACTRASSPRIRRSTCPRRPTPSRAAASRPPPPRARHLLIGAAVLLIAGITAFGVIRVLEPEGLEGIDENSVGLIDPDSGRITKQIPRRQEPECGDGRRRIGVDRQRGRRHRLAHQPQARRRGEDPRRRQPCCARVRRRLAVGRGQRLAQGGPGRPGREQGRGIGITSGTRRARSRSPAASCGSRRASTGASAASISSTVGVTQDDPGGREPVARSPPARGALWVASEEAGTVTRIDPRTGTVLPRDPGRQRAERDGVRRGRGVGRQPPRRDALADRPRDERGVVVGRRGRATRPRSPSGRASVWVAGGEEGTVAASTRTGRAGRQRFETGSSPAAIAVARRLGLGRRGRAAGRRTGAGRCACASRTRPATAIALDPLHPLAYTTSWAPQLNSLAYDGLVAYRRVPGRRRRTRSSARSPRPRPQPSRRRPDATSSRCGPGCATPTGGPSARRTSGPRWSASWRRPATCPRRRRSRPSTRHRRRSEVHAPARAVRPLARDRDRRAGAHDHDPPDPSGRGSPAQAHDAVRLRRARRQSRAAPRPARRLPAPGRTASSRWDAHRGGTLVRNRYFRSSPARSRARGFADRIEVARARRSARSSGRSPPYSAAPRIWRSSRTSFGTAGPRATPASAASRARPGQVQSGPAATTDWVFLNVRERPFDDLGVRRRSTSRSTAPGSSSSRADRRSARSTCQVVPSGFPGHAPYCPYTGSPGAGRPLDRSRHGAGAPARGGVRAGGRARHRPGARLPGGGRALLRAGARRARLPLRPCGCFARRRRRLESRDAGADRLRRLGRRLPRGVDVHRDRVRLSGRERSTTSLGSATARCSA